MKARENPFRTERVHAVRFRLQGTTWDGVMARLAALGYRAAIVGPDGSGKTMLLENLAPRLSALGFRSQWLRAEEASGASSRFGERGVILLDGADLLSRLAWQRFKRRARRAGGLIITAHRAGLLPTLFECSTSPGLLEEIVGELLPEAASSLGEVTRSLFEKHQGNLRNALRELYDRYAKR